MKTLRFHRQVYSGRAIDEAIGRLGRFAEIERAEDTEHFIVHVTGSDGARERRVAGELANHALGLTVERGGPDALQEGS